MKDVHINNPGPPSYSGIELRADTPSFAQSFEITDDGFAGALKYSWLDMQKTRKDRKSHRLSG
jgi:hypothetical protein